MRHFATALELTGLAAAIYGLWLLAAVGGLLVAGGLLAILAADALDRSRRDHPS